MPTNHVSNELWYLFMFSFPPILPLATKYIKVGVDLVYKARGCLYSALYHPVAFYRTLPPSKKYRDINSYVEVGVFANRAIF